MTKINRYRETLACWGLRAIPFRSTPPEEVEMLTRVFYGRERELEIALPALYEGRNVLVRGIWGVGKTTFIRYLLYHLQNESAALGQPMLILYVGRFPGEDAEALYRAFLFALAKIMADSVPQAKRVWETLSGLHITHSHQARIEGKVNLQLISLGGTWEKGQEKGLQLQNVYPVLQDLLAVAQKRYGQVLIAVDDLDKKAPRTALDILEEATDLLRGGEGRRGFLMTGRFISTLQDTSNLMLGLFSETITLSRMTTEELRHIAINYLNTARKRPSGEMTPFTQEIIKQVAEYAYHIPRQFNLICERVMRRGAVKGVERIDENTFPDLWEQVRDSFALELSPDIRRLLYIARRQGGLGASTNDATLEQLGVETFVELLPMLKSLEGDLLIKQEDGTWAPSMLLPDENKFVLASKINGS